MSEIRYLPYGDCAVNVEFGNKIDPELNKQIRAFRITLEKEQIPGIIETVPTYRSILIHYQPDKIRYGELTKKFDQVLANMEEVEIPPSSVIEIPTLYGGEEMGPDIGNVAAHNGLTEEEVIKIHTSTEYLIYMLGFVTGYPYLGGMDKRIATPRLKQPRVKIPAGSVAIGGEQTGVYPIVSPGGFQIIGRTPLKLYDPDREDPVLLAAGQYVKFRAVSEAEYKEIEKQVADGTYQYKTWDKEAE